MATLDFTTKPQAHAVSQYFLNYNHNTENIFCSHNVFDMNELVSLLNTMEGFSRTTIDIGAVA